MYTLFDHYYFYDAPFDIVKYPFSIPAASGKREITIKELVQFDSKLQGKLEIYVNSKTKQITQTIGFRDSTGLSVTEHIASINGRRSVIDYLQFGRREHIDLFNNYYVHPDIINDLMKSIR